MTTFTLRRKRLTKHIWILTRQGGDWWDYARKQFRGTAEYAAKALQMSMLAYNAVTSEWSAPNEVAEFMTGLERNRINGEKR